MVYVLTPCVTSMMEAPSLDDIWHVLHGHSLESTISLFDADRLLRFSRRLKQEIKLNMRDDVSIPPNELPIYIFEFLRKALILSKEQLYALWMAVKDLVW